MHSYALNADPRSSVDSELLFRLEMTARQVKGLFSHRKEESEPRARGLEPMMGHLFQTEEALSVLGQASGSDTSGGAGVERTKVRSGLIEFPSGRALLMPHSLMTPSERYFSAVFAALANRDTESLGQMSPITWLLMHPIGLERLYELTLVAYEESMSVSAIVDSIADILWGSVA
jgi:hypothetical protein